MHPLLRAGLLAFALAAMGLGCRDPMPGTGADEGDQRSLEERAVALREALSQRDEPGPADRAEFRRLVTDVEDWQRRTGSTGLGVTEASITTARRSDGDVGGDGCEDCRGYTLEGDRLCLLESEGECPIDDGSELQIGRICVYTCIWIGSGAATQAGDRTGDRAE